MNITGLKKFLKSNAGRSTPFIYGPPGGAKSSAIHQIYDELGMNFFADVRLGTMDPPEIKGHLIVDIENKATISTIPDYFPVIRDGGEEPFGIILLDEYDHALPSMQSASYQLLNDKKIGRHALPPNVWVMCASNSAADGGVHFRVPRPVKNRVIQIFAKADHEEWYTYALKNEVHPLFIAFIRANPEYLYYDSKEDNAMLNSLQAFCSPRSIFTGSKLFEGSDEFLEDMDLLREVLVGTIGYTPANALLEFADRVDTTLDVDSVIKGEFSGLDKADLGNASAMYYFLTELERDFLTNPGRAKKTQEGVLEFINMIPDVALKTVFFSRISNQYNRATKPLSKEVEALALRKQILKAISDTI
jgi:hypothetical protein